jgi:hypothetical protein
MIEEMQPGLYEVISPVRIRREPRILPENVVGLLSVGMQRTIYSVITENDNSTWGRISFADSAGAAQWICMKTLNREFVKFVDGADEPPDMLAMLAGKVSRLEDWAKTQGYKG